ncbi:MAG: GlxA family transcriptional regulator [Pseudomonadota bacterium]
MIQVTKGNSQDQQPAHRLGFVLLPSFNGMATLACIDPFRVANYLSAAELYRWQLLSLDGNPVQASSGISVAVDGAIDGAIENRPKLDMVFVCASWTPEAFKDSSFFGWLRQSARQGCTIGGLDTGAVVLAHAGLLDGYQATAHYEHLNGLKELFPDILVLPDLMVFDRDRITCGGGVAAVDMALEIIRMQQGIDLANATARYIFHDRLRPPGESQLHPVHEPVGTTVHKSLLKAISLMEHNVEKPLPLKTIARESGLSLRHMERLFRSHAHETPARFYLNLRLDRARGLITQTELQVLAVAVACGFSSAEHFTRVYRRRFSITPREDRHAGRIPFQYRAMPLHASLR